MSLLVDVAVVSQLEINTCSYFLPFEIDKSQKKLIMLHVKLSVNLLYQNLWVRILPGIGFHKWPIYHYFSPTYMNRIKIFHMWKGLQNYLAFFQFCSVDCSAFS